MQPVTCDGHRSVAWACTAWRSMASQIALIHTCQLGLVVLPADVADVNLKAYLAWVNRQACKLSDVPSERQRKQRTRKQQQQKRPQQPASRVSSRQHCRAAHDDQAQATLATAVRTRAAANKAVNAKGGPVCSAAVGCHSRRRVTRPAEPDRVSRTAVGQSGHEHRKQNQLHKGSRAQQLQAAF
jgi:hypothetical protein